MPTLMPSDTAAALGPEARNCDSRSLLLDRFCDPAAKEKDRHQVFTRAMGKAAIRAKSAAWNSWLSEPKPDQVTLHAQLQSRLMVNMAGGVMENAGLCLDRFGLPYIPGSAVKGCARRAALAALHEWCTAGGQPAHKPTGPDNPLASCCAPFATPANMLAAIARVFGWCEQDWSDRSAQSDFRWACAGQEATLKAAAEALATPFHWPIEDRHRNTPWRSLPNFAGSVSFLPAYPVDLGKTGKVDGLPLDVPQLGKLELDVVTCHHREYYSGNPAYASAPDTEEPVPVVFPAVAPGHVFTFALVPLRGAKDPSYPSDPSATPNGKAPFCLLTFALAALRTGLEVFGLGAKTNAGYGWFADVTEAAKAQLERTSRKPNEALLGEFRRLDDKKVRAAARPFMFQNTQMWPQTGREATDDYQFTLVSFILSEKKTLFDAEKNHAGSDFAKGVKRLAEKFGIAIP
ncbi:MAG: type III-B CRISPR module RAMP protein Cmr6 [Verrucomicrobia bacterium]|nr:type III-B CRISPR module RAMP protein Cmr6 [Verrucomicrobiota bacterium]